MPVFEHHLFVCLNERDESAPRPSCGHKYSKKLRAALKDAVKAAGLKHRVRVNEAGCLDQCEHGPVLVADRAGVFDGLPTPATPKRSSTSTSSTAVPSTASVCPTPASTPSTVRTARSETCVLPYLCP